MHSFTFVHAADLHLGAPFKGLDSTAADVFPLSEASFAALTNLEKLCIETNAAFLVLSGDVYDDKDGVLRARFALRDMFARLEKHGIRVFFAHGNHDPYKAGGLPVTWPGNVTVFSPEVSHEHVMRNGEAIASVCGISHATTAETANLSLKFWALRSKPDTDAGAFRIAVLHCAVGGAGEGHAPYAPCALTDLTEAGFDYWALGHVHQGRIVSEKPWVVYPGSFQGLHVNETGNHGAVVVTVTDGVAAVKVVPLAPVVWRKIIVDVTDTETVDALESAVTSALEHEAANVSAEQPEAETVFCRVILRGRTELDPMLQKRAEMAAFLERARVEFSGVLPVWVKDIVAETKPLCDSAALLERSDLVGEVARIAADAPLTSVVAKTALAPLMTHQKLKKALAGSDLFAMKDEETAMLAESAKSLLVSLLEDE
jgi:DNA repair exonuclease SbcCD nuclease subunit